MYTAELVKNRMLNQAVEGFPVTIHVDEKNLLQLQQQADRNRQLIKTTVRPDLILQEWLIRWAELALR